MHEGCACSRKPYADVDADEKPGIQVHRMKRMKLRLEADIANDDNDDGDPYVWLAWCGGIHAPAI